MKKSNKYSYVILSFLIITLFFGCNNAKKPSDAGTGESGSNGSDTSSFSFDTSSNFQRTPVVHTVTPVEEKLPKLPFNAGAHSKYVNDPLSFKTIPDGGIPNGSTAVVGSDVCLFYPIAAISSGDE